MLLADTESTDASGPSEEEIPEPPAEPVTRAGDIWCIASTADLRRLPRPRRGQRLFEGAQANLVFTSPPYATQREYDPSSGFTPVPPEEYCGMVQSRSQPTSLRCWHRTAPIS